MGWKSGQWAPLALLWATPDEAADQSRMQALARAGFCVARFDGKDGAALGAAMTALRRRYRIDQGAVHALIGSGADAAISQLLEQRHEFQTVTVFGAAAGSNLDLLRRLRTRRIGALADADAAALAKHVRALHDARALAGPAAAVSRALDSFHDAAAVADGQRYFTIFPDDAVFLGTDATERWTGSEFRAFAARYFERDSAWTYVPLERHVVVEQGGQLAWFDEVLDNAGYGECRGSGVLVRRGGRWVLRQYNLTVPVPNDLMAGVCKQIRAHQEQR